jgi:hypothetical protein
MVISGRGLLAGRVLISGSASGLAVTSGLGSSVAMDCLASVTKGEFG